MKEQISVTPCGAKSTLAAGAHQLPEEVHMAETNTDGGATHRRPPHQRVVSRLTRFVTTASTQPWAVLWTPIPVVWQLSAQSASVNRMDDYFVTT